MHIASCALALPSREVTNEEVLAEIESLSRDAFEGDLERALRIIRHGLRRSGSNTRRWCAPSERSLDLTVLACEEALDTHAAPREIDLLIYASVYPELLEPSSAALIAERLGLKGVHAFDLKAACDGFMFAAQTAELYLKSGTYKRVLVVNAEFPMTPNFAVYPQNFRLSSLEQLERVFPSYTLGEAATAVILERGGNDWKFHRSARNDLVELCTLTGSWYDRTGGQALTKIALDGAGVFTSYGSKLWEHGHSAVVDLFWKSGIDPKRIDRLFTHSSSKRDWTEIAADIGLADKLYDIYSQYGNVVSAAIPAGMVRSERDGVLARGDRVALLVGSAGMSFSVAEFTL